MCLRNMRRNAMFHIQDNGCHKIKKSRAHVIQSLATASSTAHQSQSGVPFFFLICLKQRLSEGKRNTKCASQLLLLLRTALNRRRSLPSSSKHTLSHTPKPCCYLNWRRPAAWHSGASGRQREALFKVQIILPRHQATIADHNS